ncbi:MAG: hypothetical protein ACRYGI_18025 [Janthinobacterium lividum]
MPDQDELLRSKGDTWLKERIREFATHAEAYSVSPAEVRMLFAKPRGSADVQAVFEIIVLDQHGKLYPVGMTPEGDRTWKEDGMSRIDAVSPRYRLADLQRILSEHHS